jgi:hypothetical protein
MDETRMNILFSEYFKLKLRGTENWFDPVVGHDTNLFIDPFLVEKIAKRIPEFRNSHTKVITFFNEAFQDAAKIVHRNSDACKPLLRSFEFPEVNELYLGYSKPGNPGAGSSKGYARLLLSAMFELIDAGITTISRFEELELFKEGFGADRIGDMMANLLKPELVQYTQRICEAKKIKLRPQRLRNMYHADGRVWQDDKVKLPCIKTPWGNHFVILSPKAFLRHLPTVDIVDFWNHSYSHENDVIRSQFGNKIKKSVDRETMFEAARKSAHLRESYLKAIKNRKADPYDIESDPDLLHKWYHIGKMQFDTDPVNFKAPTTFAEFITTVQQIVERYKHHVENRRGWQVIRDDSTGRGKKEKVVQRHFEGIISAYCEANNIDFSPEVDVGKGPVDFKFSSGYKNRVLLEVKLARNTKFMHGLKKQLPAYLKAEKIQKGFFIVIIYEKEDVKKVNEIREEIPKLKTEFGLDIEMFVVDAQPQKSASKL